MARPLWLTLIDKWDYILYERDKVFPNYDLSGKVLEIGCGRRGWFSLMVKSCFNDFVVTTDVLRDKVREAKTIATALGFESDGYVVTDAIHLPFRDKIFQKIIGNAVLHHVLPTISAVAREMHRIIENDGTVIFTGEIVASRSLGWLWKKISLEKMEGEGIATESAWRESFQNATFTSVSIVREHRCGYTQSMPRDIYYRLIKHLPDKFVVRYLVTSATLIARI